MHENNENEETQEIQYIERNYKARWAFVLGAFFLLSFIYYFYERDVLKFWCDKEDNASACYLLGTKFGDGIEARNYLKRSCDLKYEKACEEISNKLEK